MISELHLGSDVRGANLFFLTMLRQHSQYDSRLGLGLGLGLELVLGLWLGLGFWLGKKNSRPGDSLRRRIRRWFTHCNYN